MSRPCLRAMLAVWMVSMGWSPGLCQTVTITEDFSLTRPYHPGRGWARVTGVEAIEWEMYMITRATYQPPNPGDTNFANFYNAGYLIGRFENAITAVSFKARSYSNSANAEFEVFLNNQSLGVYTVTGAAGQTISIDVDEPGTHNLLKIQFLRWSAGAYARANIDDLAITFDTTINTPAPYGWRYVHWVHNGFGQDPKTQRHISWAGPRCDAATYVLYGETPSLGLREEVAVTRALMADNTAWALDTFLTHSALLSGLSPGATYYYRCGSDSGVSDVYSFTTEAAQHSVAFTVAVSADVQGGYNTSVAFDQLGQFLLEQDVAFWFQLGDLVQNGGRPGEWMAFFESGRSLFDNIPAMVIRGNHDGYDDPEYHYLRNLFPYLNNPNRCYAFDYGNVLMVGLDNTAAAATTPWFDSVLAASSQQWKFVGWHSNQYSTGGHGGDGLAGMLATYLPVVEQHLVTAVFNGHSHAFEVTHPIAEVGNPPVLSHATMLAPDYALAQRSQGSIFYNGAGVNSATRILIKPSQEFTITGDTAGGYRTVTLVTVYEDSVIFRETAWAAFGAFERGDVVFTCKVVDDMTALAPASLNTGAVKNSAMRFNPLDRSLVFGGLEAGMNVQLIDMKGRRVSGRRADGGSLRLDMSGLPDALYIVKITGGSGETVMRLMLR